MSSRYDVPNVAIIGTLIGLSQGTVYSAVSIKTSTPGRHIISRDEGGEQTYPISIVIGTDGSVGIERYDKMEIQCSSPDDVLLSGLSGKMRIDEDAMHISYPDISTLIKVRFVESLPDVVHVSMAYDLYADSFNLPWVDSERAKIIRETIDRISGSLRQDPQDGDAEPGLVKKNDLDPKQHYSPKEAAEYLGLTYKTVVEYMRTGKIPYFIAGKRQYIRRIDLDEYRVRPRKAKTGRQHNRDRK